MKTNMKTKTYKFYCDPGHGWLAVKRKELASLGILEKITSFSYQKGETVYLEEDVDVTTFFEAFIKTFGTKPTVVEKSHCNTSSPIRSYPHFHISQD